MKETQVLVTRFNIYVQHVTQPYHIISRPVVYHMFSHLISERRTKGDAAALRAGSKGRPLAASASSVTKETS